jgi:hypothetical protein
VSRRLGILLLAGLAVVVLSACDSTSTAGPVAADPSLRAPAFGLLPANPQLETRIELSTDRLPTGGNLEATLVIVNRSGNPINLSKKCRPIIGIELVTQAELARPTRALGQSASAQCNTKSLLVHPGTNRIRIPVSTTADTCGPLNPPGSPNACAANGGFPPLAPGTYHAILFGSEVRLPPAAPVKVTLTKAAS